MKRILFRIVLLFAASCVTPLDGAEPVLGQTARQESAPEDENLKSMLRREFMVDHDVDVVTEDWSIWSEGVRFKKDTNISDERFHAVLIDIYREAEATIQARNQESQDMQVLKNAERWMRGAVFWLGACEDVASKTFLLDLASDTSKNGSLRIIAIASYLRVADAEETKDVLLRFLTGDRRGVDPLSVYEHAAETYDHTPPEDEAKRRAIIAALMVAAAREEGKIGFVEVDRILAMRSDTYRRSRQRLAMLEHHSLEPPTKNLYTDADLKAALAESRNYRSHSSVNTNAAMLQAIDFNEERPADDAETWGGKLVIPSQEAMLAPRGVQPETAEPQVRSGRWRVASLGGLAVVVTAFVLFILHRRAGGK